MADVVAGVRIPDGAAIVLPTMFAFSAYSYWVFRGKARAFSY